MINDARRHLEKLNILDAVKDVDSDWHNAVVSEINDHVVRVSVLTRDFHWHAHPNSDELFMCLDGELYIDLEDRTETLAPGDIFTIPKGVKHRTRANGRTVNLTFEHRDSDVKGG